MSDFRPAPDFAQPERRSFLVPILLAVAALILAAGLAIHFFPATTVDIAHVKTQLLPVQTTFKADSIVTGQDQTTHVLFIASTIRVDNQHRAPITLDNFTLTLTDPSGAELTARAPLPSELPNLELTYPALKPLLAHPLPRETSVDPGHSVEGTVLFSLDIPQSVWDARKSAVIAAEVYHQPAVYVTIPRP